MNVNIFEVKVKVSKTCLLENVMASTGLCRHVQEFLQYSADVSRFCPHPTMGNCSVIIITEATFISYENQLRGPKRIMFTFRL